MARGLVEKVKGSWSDRCAAAWRIGFGRGVCLGLPVFTAQARVTVPVMSQDFGGVEL